MWQLGAMQAKHATRIFARGNSSSPHLELACVCERTGRQRWPPSLFRREGRVEYGELGAEKVGGDDQQAGSLVELLVSERTSTLVVRLHRTRMSSAGGNLGPTHHCDSPKDVGHLLAAEDEYGGRWRPRQVAPEGPRTGDGRTRPRRGPRSFNLHVTVFMFERDA